MAIRQLFKQVEIYDGTGADSWVGDVLIKDGFIEAMEAHIAESANEYVDGNGLALMPGIIDSHTHFDAQITWDSFLNPSPVMGVTTAVIGNCGFTIAPCKQEDRDLTLRNLTQVEGMSIDVLREGVHWNFESFTEYLDAIKARGTVINVAGFIGHSSIRTYVMGADATQRAASDDEIAKMANLIREAMAAGAIGFASSTSPAHNGDLGKPMPSRLANDQELMALVKAMGESGKGIFMLTKGGQTSIEFLEKLAMESKRPVFVAAILHNSTNPQVAFNDLENIRLANERGNKMLAEVSCCPLSMDFTMESPYPFEGLQSWKRALGQSPNRIKELLGSTEFRQAIKDELNQTTNFRLFNGEWSKVSVVEAALEKNANLEQKTIAEIANARGQHPLDVFFDIAIEEDLKTLFVALLLNSDEEAVGQMLNHPYSLVSLSDAGAHLTFFNDAGFGLHLMGHWARDLGKMSIAKAVHQLTGFQAESLGLKNRGFLKPGYAADLLLFDPRRVGRGQKRKVFDLPGGRSRLHTDALGVKGVWVNGFRIVNESGEIQKESLPGELIQDFK